MRDLEHIIIDRIAELKTLLEDYTPDLTSETITDLQYEIIILQAILDIYDRQNCA